MEQKPNKRGLSRRDLFARFRKQADAGTEPAQIQTDLSHNGAPPAQTAKSGKGLDRRHFLKQATVAAIGAAGMPTSALDALNQTFGITSALTVPHDNDAWLVEVAKLLDETCNNIAYNQRLTLPKGAFYHTYYLDGIRTESFNLAVRFDAEGCGDLLHILKKNAQSVAALSKAGRLPLINNPLLAQVFSNPSADITESLLDKFAELANGNLQSIDSITRPVRKMMDLKRNKPRESYERTEGWQRHIDQERRDTEQAKERDWYAYVWNK